MSVLSRFLRDEAGATAIEYGLIAAGISVVIIGVVYRHRRASLTPTFHRVCQDDAEVIEACIGRAASIGALTDSPPLRLRPRRR